MAESFSWTCPFCNQVATITDNNVSHSFHQFDRGNKDGDLGISTDVIVCPNSTCREYVITAFLRKTKFVASGRVWTGDALSLWTLRPKSNARTFPDYIPAAILSDYNEACLIANDSPKASATISRRCLQGIIRNFWGISKPRLIDEIGELEGKIDASTWKAIDAVRRVGNIGAHMEKDVNVIVDVEPEEAAALIGLIEFLLKDWYVARHDREEHMQKVIDLAAKKDIEKKAATPTT